MGTRFLHSAVLTHGSGRNDEVVAAVLTHGSGRNDEGGAHVAGRFLHFDKLRAGYSAVLRTAPVEMTL